MGNTVLGHRLDLILEGTEALSAESPYQQAVEIAIELEEARRRVSDLERQLIYASDKICGGLALGIRQSQPGLNVGIAKGSGCRVSYRNKHLMFKPNMTSGLWDVSSDDPKFQRKFQRVYAPHTKLDADLNPLALAVTKFFANHYRSLGEEITSVGALVLDGKRVTTSQLVEALQRL